MNSLNCCKASGYLPCLNNSAAAIAWACSPATVLGYSLETSSSELGDTAIEGKPPSSGAAKNWALASASFLAFFQAQNAHARPSTATTMPQIRSGLRRSCTHCTALRYQSVDCV